MSDLRDNFRRVQRAYETRRSARPQQPLGVRDGEQVRINGKPLTAREVSNEALGSGDAVVLSGDNGVLHQERGRVQARGEDMGRLTSVGKVTVLVSRTVSGQTELWLGGDRTPQLIFTVPSVSVKVLSLELVGPAKTDWVVAIQWSSTAKMISGNGTFDWQVTDPRVALLNYLGGGFWSQGANYYSANPSSFAISESKAGSSNSELLQQLGVVSGNLCHSKIEGLSTVSVEYCEEYTILGPDSLSSDSFERNEGLVQQNNLPFVFTGQNISNTRGSAQAQIVGAVSGPGYMGPGGQPVDPLTPAIIGAAFFPKKQASGESSYTRSFSSSTHHVSLHNGQLTEETGTWSISAGWQSSSQIASGGNRKKVDFLGSVREFTSPNAFLWTIVTTAIEYWSFSPGSAIQTYTDIVSSLQADVAIAPGISKNYSATITAPGATPSQGIGQAEYAFAGVCFFGGYSWQKDTIAADTPGEAITHPITGVFQFSQASRTRKFYFNWQGSDIDANSLYGDILQTWQIDENNPSLPKSNSATLLTSNDIFTKDIEAEITVSRAVTINGKLSFQAESARKKVKVKNMKSVGNGTIRAAKYWD